MLSLASGTTFFERFAFVGSLPGRSETESDKPPTDMTGYKLANLELEDTWC